MITLENSVTTLVDVGATNYAFGPGVWHFDYVYRVKGGTNAYVMTDTLRDGSIITVDVTGYVGLSEGPDLPQVAGLGVAAALATVGTALMLRYILRFVGRALNDQSHL